MTGYAVLDVWAVKVRMKDGKTRIFGYNTNYWECSNMAYTYKQRGMPATVIPVLGTEKTHP